MLSRDHRLVQSLRAKLALSNILDAGFCLKALRKALLKGKPDIFNSDQGSQFTSDDFIKMLLARQIQISMDG